jgi:hypothetical protein
VGQLRRILGRHRLRAGGHQWDSGDHPADDAFYLWGPDPPEDFVTNYEENVR